MQDQTWTTKDGTVMQVTEMTLDHCRNVIRLLERHAPVIEMKYTMSEVVRLSQPVPHIIGLDENGNDVEAPRHEWTNMMPSGRMACDAFDREMEERFRNPVQWLHTLPLLVALDARVAQ